MTTESKTNPIVGTAAGTITLILGGVRSGKSRFGEQLAWALGAESVLFVATAEARDEEMKGRIDKHRKSRPASWRTLEQAREIGPALESIDPLPKVVLLDCLTLLISNVLCSVEMDSSSYSKMPPKQFEQVQAKVDEEIDAVLRIVQDRQVHLILVSGEVGMGLVPDNALGRAFRDLLGWANQKIANQATASYFMLAGLPLELNSVASGVLAAATVLEAQLEKNWE